MSLPPLPLPSLLRRQAIPCDFCFGRAMWLVLAALVGTAAAGLDVYEVCVSCVCENALDARSIPRRLERTHANAQMFLHPPSAETGAQSRGTRKPKTASHTLGAFVPLSPLSTRPVYAVIGCSCVVCGRILASSSPSFPSRRHTPVVMSAF